jgi:NAD(P)H-hydrate epimerase
MPFPLPSDEKGRLSKNASGEILERLKSCDVCLIGPGLGRSEGVTHIVSQVIKNCRMPLIIDADGINAVSENINILDEAACPIIMTPHEGEFSRLGGSLSKGREQGASHFAREHKCTLILKGSGTVIAFEDGSILRNMTGNPGMAKGGSGDVLAGILTALIGQGISIRDACAGAVWLHGRAGDISKAELGEYSMTPTDLIKTLPKAFRELSAD